MDDPSATDNQNKSLSKQTDLQQISIDKIVEAELVKGLFQHLNSNLTASIIAATVFAVAIFTKSNPFILMFWFMAISLHHFLFFILNKKYNHTLSKLEQTNRWRIYFNWFNLMTGVIWGSAILLMPKQELLYQALIVVLVFGVASGGLHGLLTDRISCIGFIVPVLLPFLIWSFIQGSIIYTTLGAFVIIYMVLLLRVSNRSYLLFKQSIKLRIENAILNETLEKRVAERTQELQNALIQASTDPLTNLANRYKLFQASSQIVNRAKLDDKKFAILFLDLDHFKSINDIHGHDTGDKLLIYFAETLQKCIRESDLAVRLAGDEFILVLNGITDLHDINKIVEKLLLALTDKTNINGHEIKISTSIGISVYPDDGLDLESLLKKADCALYQAKENGKHQHCFYNLNN